MSVDRPTFVDTNVLVYAYDADAGTKHDVARTLVSRLWRERSAVLSTQVLQEFYVTVTRKVRRPLPRSKAREIVSAYRSWPVQGIEVDDIVAASELEERHRFSFWDALIVVAAGRAGAVRLVSEDLQAGRSVEGVRFENPFA